MVGLKSLVKRLFGAADTAALDEQQTDAEARVGLIKREFAEHPSRGLTPARLYAILEAAEQGDLKAQHDLFEDMEEKDPQIASDLAKRRQLAAELEWQITPPDDATPQERRAAEFCAEVFGGLDVEDLIIDLGSGIGHGWVNLELTWASDGARRYIEQPTFRPHSWFRLDPEDQNTLLLRDMSATGAPLWPLGWVQHRHRAKAGYIARSGLHRVLAWPYLFQNYALGDLAELLEIYGMPARIGTYPRNATDKEKGTLLRAVTSLGHRAAGIIPEGMKIEFQEAADGKGDLYSVMLDWCERSKAKAILGGTLTSGTGEGTNTNALGNVHERGQASLIRSDARQYAGTIQRDILWPLVALNFGIEQRRRAPQFYLDTGEGADLKVLAETLPVFADHGIHIPTWWFHEKSRIPQATAEEVTKGEVLQPAAQPTPTPYGAFKTITALKTAAARDAVAALKAAPPQPAELLAERLAQDAQPAIAGWLEQIEAMLASASSLEEFRGLLLAAYDQLPEDQLAEALAAGMAAADLAGIYDVDQESGT